VSPTVALVAALALLTGCSSDASGAAAATTKHAASSLSPTPTESPTAERYTPPKQAPARVPVGAPDKTKAGIFVLVWFETLDYAYASGDADPLRKTIALGCFPCANWVIEVQTQADKDVTREGGYVHVRDLAYLGQEKDDYRFRAVLNRDPGELTAPDGTRVPIVGSSGEMVDLLVGLKTSSLTGTTSWLMKAVTSPTG
jgi:hypothetical protein